MPMASRFPDRRRLFEGIDKARMLRLTEEGTFLFCSETNGKRLIHEADFESESEDLVRSAQRCPADSMVKAVRVAKDTITVSTGYAASLLRIDTARKNVLQTIGGRASKDDSGKRPLSAFFFSGLPDVRRWQLPRRQLARPRPGPQSAGLPASAVRSRGKAGWRFDQTDYPFISSLNNVIALDGLDTGKLHDERSGVLCPVVV